MDIHHIITPELVQKAFKKTGIYPLDPSVFTDKDLHQAWFIQLLHIFLHHILPKFLLLQWQLLPTWRMMIFSHGRR
jgi:hypothetical protein